MILTQAFNQAVSRQPGHTALIELGKPVTYGDLRDRIGRLSNLYQGELPQGERVALLAQNGAFFAQTFFALSNSGNPVLPLNPRDTDEAIALDLRQLQIKAILVTDAYLSRMRDLLRRERLTIELVEIQRKRAGEYDTSFQALPDRPIKDTDTILLLPLEEAGPDRRYCAFSHKQVQAACLSVKRFYQLSANDRLLTTLHWSHPFALTHGFLLPLLVGAICAVDPESASVEEFVEYIATQRVNRFVGHPKFYFQLLTFCAARKYTLPGVKSITVGIGSISLSLRKTYKLLNIPVMRCYGRTEGIWSLAMDEIGKGLDIEGARSRPVQGVRLAVLNEDGEEIPGPDRRTGRLSVMAEFLSTKYLHPDQAKAELWNGLRFRGTWLKTDEVARLEGDDEDITVAVLGKISDMLLHEGVYLSPLKIDAAAKSFAGVEDAAGFVRINKDKSPAFACALVMNQGKVNEKEFLHSMREKLPAEFLPATVYVVSALPRDAFESVNRLSLQRQFSAG